MAEYQRAPTIEGIREDHVSRYRWAARSCAGLRVLDVGCGCGYGAAILAEAARSVIGLDRNPEALAFARAHYSTSDRITWGHAELPCRLPEADAVTCFELLEHLEDDLGALREMHAARAQQLLVSVPNEAALPFAAGGFPYHKRHYTIGQIATRLEAEGWAPIVVMGQRDAKAPVCAFSGSDRTIVMRCIRK
ncbi:MAG TPA: class I SAM-dependent methyltransferase [Propylenella sp.]